jgi:hypothetical protein
MIFIIKQMEISRIKHQYQKVHFEISF